MKLKRTRLHGDPAWLWTAPNGTPFYLCRVLHSTKWVWYRGEYDAISSQMFESLDDLKDHLAQVFGSEDCMPYLYAKNEARPTVDSMFAEYKVCQMWLPMSAFFDLYPEVTQEEIKQLQTKYNEWYYTTFQEKI